MLHNELLRMVSSVTNDEQVIDHEINMAKLLVADMIHDRMGHTDFLFTSDDELLNGNNRGVLRGQVLNKSAYVLIGLGDKTANVRAFISNAYIIDPFAYYGYLPII